MDIIFAVISGIFSKTYDDIYDNKLIQNEKVYEILKGINWIFFTIICYNDFNFALVFYTMNILCLLNDPEPYLKEPYEFSLVILFPLLILISFSTRKFMNIYDLFYVLFFMTVMFFEPLLFKEEYSVKKFVMRMIGAVYSIIGVLCGQFFDVSTSLLKISGYGIGYGIASSVFQFYMLTQDNDDLLQTMVLRTYSYNNWNNRSMVSHNCYYSNSISTNTASTK